METNKTTGCSRRDFLIGAAGLGIAAGGCRSAGGLFDFTDGAPMHGFASPRPYTRIQLVSGTKGTICNYPLRIALEEKTGDGKAHKWCDEKRTAEIQQKYRHPLWKTMGKLAKRAGGHGGMDFIMDMRWAYCLQQGLPLDMDVYDLAATCCLCELTEKSSTHRSMACDIPDFTRGAWRTNKPLGIVDIDLQKMQW